MQRSAPNAHWSKDHVEHLRTVHFSLLVVSVALLAIAATRSQSEISTAHQQIKDILELARSWDADWLQAHAENRMRDQNDPNKKTLADVIRRVSEPIIIRVNHADNSEVLSLKFPEPNWTIEGEPLLPLQVENYGQWLHADLRGDTRIVRLNRPNSLMDFKRFWDALEQALIYAPSSVVEKYSLYKSRGNAPNIPEKDKWIDLVKTNTQHVDKTGEIFVDALNTLGPIDDFTVHRSQAPTLATTNPPHVDKTLELHLVPLTPAEQSVLRSQGAPLSSQSNYAFIGEYLDYPGYRIVLPVAGTVKFTLDGQSPLIGRFSQRWRHGKFSDVFRELDSLTTGYQQFDLASIETILSNEERQTGQSFEAFGIKFPAESTTRWGILIILAIQIYFWLHLRELKGKLRPEDPGWDVAWIGLYKSMYAKLVLFFSICILPPAAAAALPGRLLYVVGFSWAYGIAFIASLGGAIFLSYLLWRSMPLQASSQQIQP